MPYFPVDDQAAFHPKFVAAGNPAIGLWTRAGSWCKAHATGGHVLAGAAAALGSAEEAERLVAVGLWVSVADGFQFHDWEEQAGNFDSGKEKRMRDQSRVRQQRSRAHRKGDHSLCLLESCPLATVTRDVGVTNTVTHTEVTSPPSPSPSPDVTDTGSSSVSEREGVTDDDEGVARARSAVLSGLGIKDFGKVKATIVAATGRDVRDEVAMRIVAGLLEKASGPVESPQAYVIGSIKRSWAEVQSEIDAAA